MLQSKEFMSNQDSNQINLLKVIKWLVVSIKTNFKTLLVINILLGVLLVSAKLYIPKSFEGSLIVKSNIIEFHFISEILKPLNHHIEDKKHQSIAKTLNIPGELAQSFGGYQITSLIDEEYVAKRKITIDENLTEYEKDQVFELRIRSSDKNKLPVLKDALLNYLRSQDYIKRRQEFFLERQKDIKQLYENDITSMSRLKESFAKDGFDPNVAGNDLIIQGLGDFFFGSMRIYENYVKAWYLTEFNNSFEELSKLEIYDKHVYPRWTPFIIAFVIAGSIISLVYLLIIELNRTLKQID